MITGRDENVARVVDQRVLKAPGLVVVWAARGFLVLFRGGRRALTPKWTAHSPIGREPGREVGQRPIRVRHQPGQQHGTEACESRQCREKRRRRGGIPGKPVLEEHRNDEGSTFGALRWFERSGSECDESYQRGERRDRL